MNTRQKIEYVIQYYWLQIGGAVLGLALVLFFAYRIFFTNNENWFFLVITNTRQEMGVGSEIWKEYIEYTGYNTKVKNVEFNDNCYFDGSKASGMNNNYFQSFVAFVESKTLDAVVMEEDSLLGIGSSGRLLDLESDACASIQEKYQDRFVYCTPQDEEFEKELVAVGIDLSDSILMTKYHLYEDNCVLGIGAYAQHIDAVELFLDMVLEKNE